MTDFFEKFRKALENVFSASVQSEEELDYVSSTLLIAGLLQTHARCPRYASYETRLKSFARQLSKAPYPTATELASAGFFYTGSTDETVCPACGLGLRDWQPSDQPAACHLAFCSAEVQLKLTGDGPGGKPCPALPCLYLSVHRWLTSELPLSRKSLTPVGHVPSVCYLPGVVSWPASDFEDYASLADRLDTIVRIMTSPPAPQGWPVQNARALGHSDDLIVLALWRMQAEASNLGLNCPTMNDLRLDPHATVDLLRSILRIQEELDSRETHNDELTSFDPENVLSDSSDTYPSPEDAETAALSRCQRLRSRHASAHLSAQSLHESDENLCKVVQLPQLYDFILWWSRRWTPKQ